MSGPQESVMMAGWMHKKGTRRGPWGLMGQQKRYFVLTRDRLCYYPSSSTAAASPRGIIMLQSVRVFRRSEDKSMPSHGIELEVLQATGQSRSYAIIPGAPCGPVQVIPPLSDELPPFHMTRRQPMRLTCSDGQAPSRTWCLGTQCARSFCAFRCVTTRLPCDAALTPLPNDLCSKYQRAARGTAIRLCALAMARRRRETQTQARRMALRQLPPLQQPWSLPQVRATRVRAAAPRPAADPLLACVADAAMVRRVVRLQALARGFMVRAVRFREGQRVFVAFVADTGE